MKRLSVDAWIALSLLALLILIAAIAAWQSGQEAPPELASFSNTPNGARALRLWLDEIGFTTTGESGSVFQIPSGTRVAFILEPSTGIGEAEWAVIDEWVEAGGTLYLAGDGFGFYGAAEHYDFRLRYGSEHESVTAGSPLLSEPGILGPVVIKASAYLEPNRDDYAVLLASPDGPVLASITLGEGQVFLSTAPYAFSNAGLKEHGSPRLMLNLLHLGGRIGEAGEQRTAWFDEWHHGVREVEAGAVAGPEEWLRYTPTGRALLFSVLVIFAALLLRGRAFGRPLRPAHEIARRSPLEYVTALANLSRQAGHRGPVLRQYHARIKRHLARRYRLDPSLPDEEYVRQLQKLRPELDAPALLSLLNRLQAKKVSENELIGLAQSASDWLQETER